MSSTRTSPVDAARRRSAAPRAGLCVVAVIACLVAGTSRSVAAPPRATQAAPAREWRVTPDVEVRELQPGVWLHRSWNRDPSGERVSANGLVVRDGDGVVIVDTPWGNDATAALLDWVAREPKAPVLAVIVTHAHEDRMGGARVVHERGIPLLAAPRTVEIAAARSVANLPMALAGLDEGKAVPVGSLEVYAPGPAHAPDNVVVWLPAQRILFAGCAVKSADATSLGFTGDADLARWPEAIRRVKQRYPRAALVVPGHGDPGDATLLDRTRRLVARGDPSAKAATPRRVRRTPRPTPIPTAEPTPEEPEPTPPEEPPVPTATPVPRIVLPAEGPH